MLCLTLSMDSPKHSTTPADAARSDISPGGDRINGTGFDWPIGLTWLLGFGAVLYLGIRGGGYDALLHDQIGILAWWLLLGLVAVGALPRRRPGRLALAVLGLMAALLAWTALGLLWTESLERTWADLARIGGYLGFLALAIAGRQAGGARRMVAAVGTAVAAIALLALLSRLRPDWFPDSTQVGAFLPGAQERLSFPVDYWNGLAALIAIGLPAVLQIAAEARSRVARVAATAVLPAMALAIYFTLSRAGIAAAIVSTCLFLALVPNRLPKLGTALLAGGGGAILVAIGASRFSLVHGLLDEAGRSEGREVLWITLGVCIAVGLLRAASIAFAAGRRRPAWTRPSRKTSARAMGVAALAVVVVGLAADAPGRVGDGWDEFKSSTEPLGGASRLASVGGESRYALWSSAVREMEAEPVTGTGSGTFELWWHRDGDVSGAVIDAHSLYLQTLGELGAIGFALIVALFGTILIGGGIAMFRAPPRHRAPLAAALAGFVAFCLTASVDWVWQLPVVAIASLLLAGVLVAAPDDGGAEGDAALPAAPRVGAVLACLVAILAISVQLSATALLRESQEDARDGDTAAALAHARDAQNVEPGAAGPRLQEALLLEGEGALAAAAAAARAAIEREGTNWRLWVVLSRIEGKRGNASASVAAYRRARSLNPLSPLFNRDEETDG